MERIFIICIFVALFNASRQEQQPSVSCKDERGNDVDWWYMYKLPKHYSEHSRTPDTSGLRYLYITSNDYDTWQVSQHKISEANSLTAQTLNPIFASQRTLLAAYNDEFPNGTVASAGGHTKGVVATDGQTGIWLVHSVPKFPDIPQYAYPETGTHYAQSLHCLSLNAEGVDRVGEVLIYNEPHFYYERVPLTTIDITSGVNVHGTRFPNLARALNRQWRTAPPFSKSFELYTSGGKKFMVFGKSGRANQELYADLVAPTLDVNLLVETWRNGGGNLPPSCTQDDKVFNVDEIKAEGLDVEFRTTADHSKWAVSQASGVKLYRWRIGGADWTCVGDINRQRHQMVRGGGTVCLKSSRIAELYRKLVKNFENCKV